MSLPQNLPKLPQNLNLQTLQALPKEKVFLGIRAFQLLLLIVFIIVEIAQVATYASFFKDYSYSYSSKYYKNLFGNPAKLYYTNTTYGKGGSVIWVYIVVLITLIGVIGYAAMFKKKIWEKRKEIYFMAFDAAFVVLWFTAVLTNLVLVYRGKKSICHGITSYSGKLKHSCNAYIASNILGCIVLISFALATALSWKVYNDEKNGANPTNQFGIVDNNNMI
ncbi:1419_t:CDS:2, partial [Diversispora eburnea]